MTREETRLALPGDELVERLWWVSARAITMGAPPEDVWPWVVRVGSPTHRTGRYVSLWPDELIWGRARHSADELRPELQDIRNGAPFLGGRMTLIREVVLAWHEQEIAGLFDDDQ